MSRKKRTTRRVRTKYLYQENSTLILSTIKWLICIAIIIGGIFCITDLYHTFRVKNAEYGTPITNITRANQEEVIKYELDYIDFLQSDNGYIATYTFESLEDFDGEKNKYVVYFNGIEITDTQTAGTLKSNLIKTFYDTNNKVSANINILIEMKFTVSGTVIQLSTNSSGNDLAFFGNYMTLNGATITIAKEI